MIWRLTLRQCSAASVVSVGYLSQGNVPIATPPLGSLARSAAALTVHFDDFFVLGTRVGRTVDAGAEPPFCVRGRRLDMNKYRFAGARGPRG